MNYIGFFLEKISPHETGAPYKTYETPDSNSPDSSPGRPTKPTKPGFVGFVGTPRQEMSEITTCPEGDPEEIPDRSVWRSVVAGWPIAPRQEWADLAERHQVNGRGWRE